MDRMITTREAARMLGLSIRTLEGWRLADDKRLTFYRIHGAIRYSEAEVRRMLAKSRISSADGAGR